MIEGVFNVIVALLVGLSSLTFSVITMTKYNRTKLKSHFLELLFFLFFGLGWTFIGVSLGFYELGIMGLGELFIKLGVSSIAVSPLVQITLAAMLFSPKKVKIALIIGLLFFVFNIVSMAIFPLSYGSGDYEFNSIQKLSILANSFVNIFAASMFIFYSRKSKNNLIKKKSLLFGIGLLFTVSGSVVAALVNNFVLTIIIRLFILFGVTLFFVGTRDNK